MNARAIRLLITLLATGLLLLAAVPASAAIIELKNDGLVDEGQVGFQTGFVTGEMGAATLGPVGEAFVVNKIYLVFGPEQPPPNDAVPVGLKIYIESGETDPGTLLYDDEYHLEPSSTAIQEIDLTAVEPPIQLAGGTSIRVAIEMKHDDEPSIARDNDGCTAGVNWIYGTPAPDPTGWYDFCALGGEGDWVIRAEVETEGEGGYGGAGGAGGTPSTGGQGGSAIVCATDESTPCIGSDGCEGTKICLPDRSGWGPCDCGATDDDDGCGCSVPGAPASGQIHLLGLALLALLVLRRAGP